MDKVGETTLEIDLSALEHNFRYLKSKLLPETKFLAVVKAFAYGSDMVAIAKKMETLGVDYFAVAYVKEGVLLRDAGIMSPILVLHPQPVNFGELIDRCLEPSLYSQKILKQFLKTAHQKKQKDYPVHLKFNTGLNRLGFWETDAEHISAQLAGRNEIKIKSIFSHLAASEDLTEKEFSQMQIKTFEKISAELNQKLGYSPFRHMLNTSGIINYPKAQFEMVRSGIGLYGYGNDAKEDQNLKPVATLKTIISQIHKIEPGETVGYNRAFASEDHRISATLPIGHADGIGRQYGKGKAHVTIHGKKAPIIGNVCMDMIMVDVTDIDCQEGDEVLVFGENASAEQFATLANTISYEILTAISQRVKRTYKDT
ncbi:alanine racemase [Flagellimonas allohymeniacidonis]|uniref:Alanine racemase n=1 Tax=Flagellimonas allohymeniacidonis TaxID=2517819 RepID=A0A4Q8QBE0_9FLAO|nr:alanine racemase [Allomuricauda hymeniacidonis]TAI47672.1 alanine racemase [Allomuricauda hymeniacidonis]